MSFQLTLEEGRFLVRIARKAVEEYLKSRQIIPVPKGVSPELMEHCGVFVTLHTFYQGEKGLRGCIGFPYPTKPLIRAVIESAINSATKDPRFHPVSLDELHRILFEVSVLTPPQPVRVEKPTEYPSKIKVGQDGLIIERSHYKGLLLPQVPVDWGWEEEEFLCQCCMKAGLSPDSWLLEDTEIYKFSCVIAQETTPDGEINLVDMRKC